MPKRTRHGTRRFRGTSAWNHRTEFSVDGWGEPKVNNKFELYAKCLYAVIAAVDVTRLSILFSQYSRIYLRIDSKYTFSSSAAALQSFVIVIIAIRISTFPPPSPHFLSGTARHRRLPRIHLRRVLTKPKQSIYYSVHKRHQMI